MWNPAYRDPEPSLEPPELPEPKVLCRCKYCNDDVCEGDEVVEYNDDIYHYECFSDIALKILVEEHDAIIIGEYHE